jgi:hypothetical protein
MEKAGKEEVRAAVAAAVEGGVITEEELGRRLKEIGLKGEQFEKRRKIEGIDGIKQKFEK